MSLDKVEFVKLYNAIKDCHETETAVYMATGGAIDLGATASYGKLTDAVIRLMADNNELIAEAIYDLLFDGSVGFADGYVAHNPVEFYDFVFNTETKEEK